MEAARRADEWPRLLEKIPGPETVVGDLQRVPNGLGATTHTILEKLQQPISMHELATHARVPVFEVYETVAQAVENNMARVLERPRLAIAPSGAKSVALTAKQGETNDQIKHPAATHPRRSLGPGLRRFLIWLSAFVILGCCLLGSGRQIQKSLAISDPTSQQVEAARARLVRDLEIHRAVFGAYPADLETLLEAEITTATALAQARVEDFHLVAGGTSYRISYMRRDS